MVVEQDTALAVTEAVVEKEVVARTDERAAMTCRKGHVLQYAPAPKGTCDGCRAPVPQGKLVSDCRECNYYLCTSCTPISTCPKGHEIRTGVAMAGKCDGCSAKVSSGALVMECKECNWYLCKRCQPPTQCPKGHGLKLWACQVTGKCDLCKVSTKQGQQVMDCRECNWFLCAACHPTPRPRVEEETPIEPLPQCPQGHNAIPVAARPGRICDRCEKAIRPGAMLSECFSCNFHICASCHPIRQCKVGHTLEARTAVKGTCDGCGKKVETNQSVLDCRHCNYYLCGSCHMPPARGGA